MGTVTFNQDDRRNKYFIIMSLVTNIHLENKNST